MKKKVILTVVFVISLLPMLLPQYGGMKGVSEISGLINLTSLLGVASVVFFLIGVWGNYEEKSTGRWLGGLGVIGIIISELYNYFTWHVETITGEISLQHSINFAFPEFYFGLAVSLVMAAVYFIMTKCKKQETN